MTSRSLWPTIVLILFAAACSVAEDRPAEFADMRTDEVGCTVLHDQTAGDPISDILGPVAAGGSAELTKYEYLFVRVGRTVADVLIVANTSDWGLQRTVPLSDLPEKGYIINRPPGEMGGPAVTITCWRGSL